MTSPAGSDRVHHVGGKSRAQQVREDASGKSWQVARSQNVSEGQTLPQLTSGARSHINPQTRWILRRSHNLLVRGPHALPWHFGATKLPRPPRDRDAQGRSIQTEKSLARAHASTTHSNCADRRTRTHQVQRLDGVLPHGCCLAIKSRAPLKI